MLHQHLLLWYITIPLHYATSASSSMVYLHPLTICYISIFFYGIFQCLPMLHYRWKVWGCLEMSWQFFERKANGGFFDENRDWITQLLLLTLSMTIFPMNFAIFLIQTHFMYVFMEKISKWSQTFEWCNKTQSALILYREGEAKNPIREDGVLWR